MGLTTLLAARVGLHCKVLVKRGRYERSIRPLLVLRTGSSRLAYGRQDHPPQGLGIHIIEIPMYLSRTHQRDLS